MSSTSTNQNVAVPLAPLAETAAQFRQECSALDHLVEELYRDVEQLRDELIKKSDEIEEGRRKLAERGAQLADQRKESGKLLHLLEQQETRLGEALTEIKSLREQSVRERDEAKEREGARFAFLEQKLRAAETERDQLRHEVNVLQAAAASTAGGGVGSESLAPLMSELGDMRRQLSETQAQFGEARTQLAAAIEQSSAAAPQTLEAMPALMAELGEMRKQLGQTQAQLGEARTQLATAIEQSAASAPQASEASPALLAELTELRRQLNDSQSQFNATVERAVAAAAQAQPVALSGEGQPADEATREHLANLDRERVELESELELVRTRATELQEVVNQQRRELVEQRADVTTELRLLRELVEQRPVHGAEEYLADDEALVGAAAHGEPGGPAPDPVVSSVMAQFARLQKDVAQRRKKK